jgi:hypothetical protein
MEGLNKTNNIIYILSLHYGTIMAKGIPTLNSTKCIENDDILSNTPKEILEIITGNLLGDGSLRKPAPNINSLIVSKANASYSMTLSVKGYNYLVYLYNKVYAQFSSSKIHPYPNISLAQHKDKIITQYSFTTMRTPLFTALHAI